MHTGSILDIEVFYMLLKFYLMQRKILKFRIFRFGSGFKVPIKDDRN
jgi:hypothetical protein